MVKDFKADDVVVFEANPCCRDPDKPAFGASVERFMVNQTNPDPALGDKRSTLEAGPHPSLTDPRVVRALSLAIDREILVEAGCGAAGQVTCNVLPAPAICNSTANDWCKTPDIDAASKLLHEAGWKRGPDGVRLSYLYQTSTNSVRQGAQALIKQMWQAIGVETEPRDIDAAVFFGGDPASPDTFQKFYADLEMHADNFDGTDSETCMGFWKRSEIPGPDSNWLGADIPRFRSAEYDALSAEMSRTAALEKRAELAKKMNDMLINAGAIIPLIHRGGVSAHARTPQGVRMNEWDSEPWNIADWSRAR